MEADLAVAACLLRGDDLVVTFGDSHMVRLALTDLRRALGWSHDVEEPPVPEPWSCPLNQFPYVEWNDIGWSVEDEQTQEVVRALGLFFRHGYVVFRGVPTEPGTLRRVADRLGYLVGTNFGELFDVRVEENPTDLAFTSIELQAHTDLPYRKPIPGIQLLHCLHNEASGGDSTLADGLAAASALEIASREMHRAMVETKLSYRYDIGADTVVNCGYTLEYDRDGLFQQIRFNTKLDEPIVVDGLDLSTFYDGRRWLAEWLNEDEHRVTFRLEPGDVMLFDNHRLLHGRTQFDPSRGKRHLQGCYIEHDGPDTMYRLAVRRLKTRSQKAGR